MKKHLYFLSIVFISIAFCTKFKGQDTTPSIAHLNVAILLDSGDEDGKGGVFTSLAAAIRDKVPVIASSYLIKILIDNKDKEDHRPIKTLFAELLDANQWSLFKNTLSDFVVALPNNFWPHLGKINEEKLALIGLNKDFLTQIESDEFEDIFKNIPVIPINMDSLENLFLINPNIRKRIYLIGHGHFDERMQGEVSNSSIAQLTVTQYQRFLNFLNTIGTDILYVTSCYSGGLNLLTPYLKQLDTMSFAPKQRFNYFIMVQATTDAMTSTNYTNTSFKLFFSTINEFFSPQGPTMKNQLRSIAQHIWGGNPNNIPSVRFPGSLHYFKAIDVDGKTEIITQAKVTAQVLKEEKGLKQVPEIGELSAQIKEKQEKGGNVAALGKKLEEQLTKLKESSQKHEAFLKIQNKKALLLYPLMIPAFLSIDGSMPNIISMIPGNAIHYIDKISTREFIDTFFLAFYNLEIESTKLFFIKNIVISDDILSKKYITGIADQSQFSAQRVLENVFIKVDNHNGIIIFKIGDSYYEGEISYTSINTPVFTTIGSLTGGKPTIFDEITKEEAFKAIIQEVKNLRFLPETIQFLGGKEHLEKQLNIIMKKIIPGWIAVSLLK